MHQVARPALLVEREHREQDGAQHVPRRRALGDLLLHLLRGLGVEDLQRLDEQLVAGAEVVLDQAHRHAGLRGDLPQRHVLQPVRAGEAPDGGGDVPTALVVVDPLGHGTSYGL
jgi:hypothetical protein